MSDPWWRYALILATGALVLAGCATSGRGDPDGVETTLVVDLDRAYVRSISREVVLVGDGPGAEDGKEAAFGFGHGTWTTTTEVELRGGTRPGAADLFLHDLRWGRSRVVIPLRPGRTLHLGVLVFGARQGSAVLEPMTVPPGPDGKIAVDLTGPRRDPGLPASAAE